MALSPALQSGLVIAALNIGQSWARQAAERTTDEELNELADRLAVATELLTRPPAGTHYIIIAVPTRDQEVAT